MLDSNLSIDKNKLEYIAGIQGGGQLLMDLLHENMQIVTSRLANRIGMRDMLRDQEQLVANGLCTKRATWPHYASSLSKHIFKSFITLTTAGQMN